MQTFSSNNLQQISIGPQIDLGVANGANATVATTYFSASAPDVQNTPPVNMVQDNTGDRTTNSYAFAGDRDYPFKYSMVCDVNKIGIWLYYMLGSGVGVQDGATGAYQWTFRAINNVLTPPFTLFVSLGAEGYKRLTRCRLSRLQISVRDQEATVNIEGMACGEDDTPSSSLSATGLTLTTATYQAATGLIRYTYTGTPTNIASVKNGDILDTTLGTTLTTINKGKFFIVAHDQTGKTIDVINIARADATADQTAISSTGSLAVIVTTPAYPTPIAVLLRRHSAVRDAVNLAGLTSATDFGLRNFDIEFINNTSYIREGIRTADPSEVFHKNLEVNVSFTQTMTATTYQKANASRTQTTNNRAWRFEMADTSKLLGTSNTYNPLLRVDLPQAMAMATRNNMGGKDELVYDWVINTQLEQQTVVTLQNTISAYP